MPFLPEPIVVEVPPVSLLTDLSQAWLEKAFLRRLRYPAEKDGLSLPVSLPPDSLEPKLGRPVFWQQDCAEEDR